jgi:chorismate mutase
LDITVKKMLKRMDEIDTEISKLRSERNHLTSALASVGYRPPNVHPTIYESQEVDYGFHKPFRRMSLTDACLKVLKDRAKKVPANQWLDKNQVEYLVARGGYEFKARDATNSVNVTLQRLANGGFCGAQGGSGSRSRKYRFLKDREPEAK